MDQAAITAYIAETCPGTEVVVGAEGVAAGDTFFIYDPDRSLQGPQRFPFATIVTKDYGEFDHASNLNRDGVFRLNIGIGRATFQALFGDAGTSDFAALDRLLPHPVYCRQWWVCVLNPSAATFDQIKPLLREAYERAAARLGRRQS